MNSRNTNFIKQIKFSFIYKIITIVISFLVIRYMVEYLGVEMYGIWSVLLTFINFILFFDLGITNGVKNKVSVSLVSKNYIEAKKYISTGYFILSIIVVSLYMILYFVSAYINWNAVFNTNSISLENLRYTVLISTFFILCNFLLSIVIAVYNALQKTSFIILNQLLSQMFSLLFILLLIYNSKPNIIFMSFSYGFSLLLSNLILSTLFYKMNYNLRPAIKYIDLQNIKPILSLGLKFFVLQLTIFIMLSSDKIIIAQLLGADMVTSYDILYKYFSVIIIIHSIINTPLWSMYTEAYHKNDFKWIEKTLRRMIKLTILYMILGAIMIFMASIVISLWIGNVELNLSLSNYIYMFVLILVLSWYSIFAYFTNGIDKTNIQLLSAVFGSIVNVPLSIYFVKYLNMELNGIVLATIISLLIFGIIGPIQAYNEIKNMKLQEGKLNESNK